MAIVWPCPLPVDAYVAAGREVEVPRPVCPSCAGPLVFWSGYWRHVRAAGRCRKIFVARVRCGPCRVSHALLPAFLLAWRLDVAEAVGVVIGQVAGGACGVRPAAARAGVPHTTARDWVRRFGSRAGELGAAFAALAVDLGGEAICAAHRPGSSSRSAAASANSSGWARTTPVSARGEGMRASSPPRRHARSHRSTVPRE